MPGKKVDDHSYSPVVRLGLKLESELPALCRLAVNDPGDFIDIRIKQRGAEDWLAIVRRLSEDGTPLVLFAFGLDFVSCLIQADRLMQANKWKVDTPWNQNGSGGK